MLATRNAFGQLWPILRQRKEMQHIQLYIGTLFSEKCTSTFQQDGNNVKYNLWFFRFPDTTSDEPCEEHGTTCWHYQIEKRKPELPTRRLNCHLATDSGSQI
jgi:hypothetical protein